MSFNIATALTAAVIVATIIAAVKIRPFTDPLNEW